MCFMLYLNQQSRIKMAKDTDSPVLMNLTPEIVSAQGKNDREYLTTRVNLLLSAIEKHPQIPVDQIEKLAGSAACGQGCCCCCSLPLTSLAVRPGEK